MTLIISPDGVKNTSDTNITMGKAKIKVGGSLTNEGKMSLHETDLEVAKDLIQKGDFKVNDPHYFAKAVLELVKSTKDLTKIGAGVIKLLSGA